ncbi:hypothetical protein SRHO_G00165190 [Serrasalmus rhombeus]
MRYYFAVAIVVQLNNKEQASLVSVTILLMDDSRDLKHFFKPSSDQKEREESNCPAPALLQKCSLALGHLWLTVTSPFQSEGAEEQRTTVFKQCEICTLRNLEHTEH